MKTVLTKLLLTSENLLAMAGFNQNEELFILTKLREFSSVNGNYTGNLLRALFRNHIGANFPLMILTIVYISGKNAHLNIYKRWLLLCRNVCSVGQPRLPSGGTEAPSSCATHVVSRPDERNANPGKQRQRQALLQMPLCSDLPKQRRTRMLLYQVAVLPNPYNHQRLQGWDKL